MEDIGISGFGNRNYDKLERKIIIKCTPRDILGPFLLNTPGEVSPEGFVSHFVLIKM